jgi:protein gp37
LHCYATSDCHRFHGAYENKPGMLVFNSNPRYPGLTFLPVDRLTKKSLGIGAKWTGEIRWFPHRLLGPLGRGKAALYFINSVSDPGHRAIAHDDLGRRTIAAMMGLFVVCPQHIAQVLTKRSKFLREWFGWAELEAAARSISIAEFCVRELIAEFHRAASACEIHVDGAEWREQFIAAANEVTARWKHKTTPRRQGGVAIDETWPRRNIHIGASVEDALRKKRLDELRATPAAVRFTSFEPLIDDVGEINLVGLDWAIWGGESKERARECHIEWLRNGVRQCRRDGIAPFVKQLGARPMLDGKPYPITDAKGGNMDEFPEDLRVREFPR